jgi:hypothetical protein
VRGLSYPGTNNALRGKEDEMVRRNFDSAKALAVVRRAGWAIRFIEEPSEEVRLEEVGRDGLFGLLRILLRRFSWRR